MTNKPMLSVERELLENIALGLENKGFGINWAVELRALLDKEADGDSRAPKIQSAPVAWIKFLKGAECKSDGRIYDLMFCAMPGYAPLYAEQPEPVAVSIDIESAAKKLAECMDYPWEFMPEQGRQSMRESAKAVFDAARLNGVKP